MIDLLIQFLLNLFTYSHILHDLKSLFSHKRIIITLFNWSMVNDNTRDTSHRKYTRAQRKYADSTFFLSIYLCLSFLFKLTD